MTSGVCYFLCGGGKRQKWRRYLSMLTVSLHSLRQHYDGPVCILVGTDIFWDALPARFEDVVIRPVPITQVPAHAGYVTKASVWRYAPFDRTILLDADTVVTGDIEEMFYPSLGLTRFAAWNTHGNIVGGRVRQWESVDAGCAALAKRATSDPWPAINTGVVSWHRDCVFLHHWETLSQVGYQCSFTDELAMQLLLPDIFQYGANGMPLSSRGYINDRRAVITAKDNEPRLFSDAYNCSPQHGINRENARIWHYHGRRMLRNPPCGELYRPHVRAALEANFGGIRDWLQDLDPALWELSQPAL